MTSQDFGPRKTADLRWRAEEVAREKGSVFPESTEVLSPRDMRRTLHELRVHQIELELQNEELRRVQIELNASRVRYFDLYDLAPVGYCILSMEGLVLEINLTAVNLLGVPRAVILQQPITRYIHREDQDIYYLHRKRFLETGEPYACDLRMVRKDGTVFWAHLAAVSAQDTQMDLDQEAGHAIVSRLVLSDITGRKEAEEAQSRLEAELQQAQKLKTLGVLAGGIAHDFNNILTAIMGNANLGQDAAGGEGKVASYFEAIEKAALRASELTQQMLAYAGQEAFVVGEVDVNRVVKEILPIISVSIPRNVTLQCDLTDPLPFVMADPTQIYQVMMNLITNGLEAIPENVEGLVTIRTGAEGVSQFTIESRVWALPVIPGRYVTLEVADTGVGMVPEVVTQAFDPFFTTRFTGRGLGLAAVIGILSSHGGGICVRSEPGQGASFKVFLPEGA